MRVTIAAIGKAKASPEEALYQQYIKRLPWKITHNEFDIRIDDPAKRKSKEAEKLLEASAGCDRLIALDERGKNLSSRELAETIQKWQQAGSSSFAFVIGGADGLDASVTAKADLLLSFGKVTWPHMLMRAMVAEQLYRTWSLISGHPYHRD